MSTTHPREDTKAVATTQFVDKRTEYLMGSDAVLDVTLEDGVIPGGDRYFVVFRYGIPEGFAERFSLDLVSAFPDYRSVHWWEVGPFKRKRLVGVFKRGEG